MSDILDYIVSNTWLKLLISGCLIIGILIIFRSRFSPKKRVDVVFRGSLCVVLFILIIFLFINNYGYAEKIIALKANDRVICLVDEYAEAIPYDGGSKRYRMHIIDSETGRRYVRKGVSGLKTEPIILALSTKEVVLYEDNWIRTYNIVNGDLKSEWSSEEGYEQFPELTSGIHSMELHNQRRKQFIKVLANNGRRYYFNPIKQSLQKEPFYIGERKSSLENNGVHIHERTFRFVSIEESLSQIIGTYGNTEITAEGTYLRPEFITVGEDEWFVFRHKRALDSPDYIYTSLNYKLEVQWEYISSSKEIMYEDDCPFDISDMYLYFSDGGNVTCLNLKTGEMRWSKDL